MGLHWINIGNFSGPESCFVCAVFTFKVKLSMIQWNYQLTKRLVSDCDCAPIQQVLILKFAFGPEKFLGLLGVSRNGAQVLLCNINLVKNSVTRPSLPASLLMLVSKIKGAVSVYLPRKPTVIKKLLQNGKTMTASGQKIKLVAKFRHTIWLKRFYTENNCKLPEPPPATSR